MKSADQIRERKLDEMKMLITRPGMMAVGVQGVSNRWHVLIEDLLFLDDREDEMPSLRARILAPFGSVGPTEIDQWFDGLPTACTAEVSSVWAEQAARLGYLPTPPGLSEGDWRSLALEDPARYESRDWTMSELLSEFPAPTLIVDQKVACYAPDDGGPWAFFDFYQWPPPLTDPRLRDVRVPDRKAYGGLVLTPHGRQFASKR